MEEERGRGVNEEYEGRGAGGKLTTRSSRLRSRAQSTPYNRPPPVPADKSKSGWFSKLLVKPASKILHLPSSLFHFSSSKNQDQHQDQSPFEYDQDHATDSVPTSDNQFVEPNKLAMDQKHDFKDDDPVGSTLDESGISEIEKRLQRKKLSKDERDRLIELLQARTVDLLENNGEAARLKVSEVTLGQNELRRSVKDYGVEFDFQMTPKVSKNLQFKAHDVGCSPVDIAKAYMESRTSSSSYDCPTGKLKNDNTICTDSYASKSPFTPVVRSPVCWPGASVQSEHGYFTPRRGGILHPPRTPYSGALFSKSTSKFSVNAERANRPSAERSPTHVFGRNLRTPSRMVRPRRQNDATPSLSPAHDISQKSVATTWEGGGPSDRTASFSALSNSLDASSSFSPAIERNLDNGLSQASFHMFGASSRSNAVSKYSFDSTTVHPQSSALARKILEHLDTSVPSPREKSLEIKLARKKVSQKSDTDTIDGLQERPDVSISGEQKSGFVLGADFVAQGIADAQKVLPGQSTSTSTGQLMSFPQSSKQDELGLLKGSAASDVPDNHLSNSAAPQIQNSRFKSSYATPITITKFGEKIKNSDNGFSFSFPVSASTSSISEPPPTPTMASPRTKSRELEAGDEGIPLFKFRPSTSSERLVFSFGSAVGSSDPDTSTPTFKFGTGNNNLSFKMIGAANAIC